MQPILSIIVPVFNAEKYLKSCLLSLLNQTMHEIEVICIDDGSTDESLAILNNLQKKDSRLIVYSQKNQGPAVARNKGLELSTGKYILFCDADDEYKKTYCKIMYKTISSNDELDFVICRTVQINRDLSIGYNYFVNRYFITNKWKKYINTTFNLDQDKKSDIDICLWNKIFRKKNILKYGINFPVNHKCDDNLFVYKYLAISKKAKILDKELYVHYDRQNSIMDLYFSNIDYESIYDHIYII